MPEIVLNPVVDSLDDVHESHRDLYENRDGKFVISKPIKIDDPTELRSALAQERELRKKASEASKNLPPDIQEKIKKADELERRELERKGEYERSLKSVEERLTAANQKTEERNKLLSGALETTLTRNAATIALNAARGDVEGLLPHLLPILRAVEDPQVPGRFDVIVVDPKNPNEPKLNGKMQPMTIEEAVAELRDHRSLSKLFDATPASGPGGNGSTFRAGQQRIVKLTDAEAKDPRRYEQLKEQKRKGEIDGAEDHLGRRLV
ncbi:hypothetical protein [Gemmatimonas sp.]